MNDNIYILQTENERLRPVELKDAEFIVRLRNQSHVVGRVHDTSQDVERQRQWINEYLTRDNEYYWIIESLSGEPLGTFSFYHYDKEKNQIESGRWVRIHDSSSGSLSEEVLLKDFAFKVLNVSKVVADVVTTNKKVVKLHRFLGEREMYQESGVDGVGGTTVDVIWFEVTKEMWETNRKKMLKFCGKDEDRIIFQRINNELIKINY